VKASNPKRVAAGRANRKLRGPITGAGRQRLRETALANQPWRFSTGPRTPAGKRKAAANGKTRQIGPVSVREAKAEVAGVRSLVALMQDARDAIARQAQGDRPGGESPGAR